ncbi:AraC family transcriptional regulator [Nocardioides immobilis]|uniref:AraC family transcriptional regulator n=1 Tax=Nocardioides immobilis TaxID=2049295 RepID=A0A417XXP7_9ACTN|nr:AraC family transcriptional regulator [Nocardioides immobilis]RHW24917.1 AraC family transcriptional regulator [Nocardioides immobilis]
MGVPLEARAAFHTRDVDQARELVARAFCSHRLELLDGSQIDVRQNSAGLANLSLHYLDYGADVRISPEPLQSFFLVQIPLAGVAEATSGGVDVVSTPQLATVLSPHEPVSMRWTSGTPHLCVRIDREALETKMSRMIGRSLKDPLTFELGLPMDTPSAISMRHFVDMLRFELETDNGLSEQPLIVGQLEDLLMTSLLLSAPHNYTERLNGDHSEAAPRTVRRAMEIIEDHAHEPLTVEDIAEAVGTSVRALQSGFRNHVGSSPMGYLRDVRLDLVHKALVSADPGAGVTVTDVALAKGFMHLGRFAQAYREKYGVSPSTTLRS